MRKKLFLLILVIGQCVSLLAQERVVSGSVKGNDGEPLIGASVAVKGTSTGVITDLDGRFRDLNVPANGILVVSYIGYETKEVRVTSNVVNVILGDSSEALDEVIVVAYGTASKAGYTGSASVMKKDQIEKAQVSSISRLLQGSASGVQSISSSGQPGSDADIFIRGIGSLNAESTPMYIVDGAPYDGVLSSINPADIESINVLKDASATSLYGSRAANGLIIVTTKQGSKNQKTRVDASFRYGVSSRAQDSYKHVTTDQYFELTWEALYNSAFYGGQTADAARTYATNNLVSRLIVNPYGSKYPNPVGTDGKLVSGATALWDNDWVKEYEQDAKRTEAQVNIAGGGSTISYFVSMGYLKENGIAPVSDFERYTGRVNLKADLTSWMRLTTNISMNHSVQDAPQGYDSASSNALFTATLIPSFYPIWQVDLETGKYKEDANGNRIYDFGNGTDGSVTRPAGASPRNNHLADGEYNFRKNTRDIASVRASLEIDLYKGLTYTGSLNVDYNSLNYHRYENPIYGSGSTNSPPGYVYRSNARTTGFTGNNILTYRRVFNDIHTMKVMAGQEYYEHNYSILGGDKYGFPSLGLTEPDAASLLSSLEGYSEQYKLLSFFGNAEYNYDSRYFFSGSLRTDGSSRFHKDHRWGIFWALGASWRISEEEFMKGNTWLSKLTLRASYGGQGNDKVGKYAYHGLYDIQNNLGESGYVTSQLENVKLKWESNMNLNVALDFGLWNDRLSGTLEFFNRQSKDLLFSMPMPTSTGFASYYDNSGKMRNRGIEFQLSGTPVKTRNWQWNISVNGTHYKNKITELPDAIISSYQIKQQGGTAYDWFLAEWAGVDSEDGLPMWYMTNDAGERVTTKTFANANTTKSRIVAGSSLPDLVGGFSTSLRYKDFELSAMFAYSIGGTIYDRDKSYLLNQSSAGRSMSTETLNRWTPENRYTDVPRVQTTTTNWTSISTRFLYDADYMRMKNLSLAYNLPKSILSHIYLNSCRLYVQGENLFTIFGTEGIDPEQAVDGLSYMRYPNAKTISFGINVSF